MSIQLQEGMEPQEDPSDELASVESLAGAPAQALRQCLVASKTCPGPPSGSVILQRSGSTVVRQTSAPAEGGDASIAAALRGGRALRDSRGVVQDLQELRRRRHEAVLRGMKFMHKLLIQDKCAALHAIGDDAACVFFEIWYTSADSLIRANAKGIAIDLLKRYQSHILYGKQQPYSQIVDPVKENRNLFFELMFLVRCYNELGMDAEPLLSKADQLYRDEGYEDPDRLFGIRSQDLRSVKLADWTVLIMNIMIIDFNNRCLFQNRWPCRFGLLQAFSYLRTFPLAPPGATDEFFHSYYFATHMAFAISAYSAIKTAAGTATALPAWLSRYIWESLRYFMQRARRWEKDPSIDLGVDIDGIAEAIDVLRCCGLNDGNHPLICEATFYLLSRQLKNGSWPCSFEKPTFYDRLHPTWVVTQSLRDRNFDFEHRGNTTWGKIMAKCLKASNIRKPTFKIPYRKGKGRRASDVLLPNLLQEVDQVGDADRSNEEGLPDPLSGAAQLHEVYTDIEFVK